MDHFQIRNGELHAEGVPLSHIAEVVGTPFYCYSSEALTQQFAAFTSAFAKVDAMILYAVKANSNQSVIRTFANLNSGADVVSGGELYRAIAAGIPANRIVFSGVGKTRDELTAGLAAGVLQFNVESAAELMSLSEVAVGCSSVAPVALRINPDVDAETHNKIATGRRSDKFGVPWSRAHELYDQAASLPGIHVTGLSIHIGSQITELKPFIQAFSAIARLATELKAKGHDIRHLDLGGGLGIRYNAEDPPSPTEYADIAVRETAALGCRLLLEPGRALVGTAGILVTSVLYEKRDEDHRILVVDAAMNDLLRPALYDAYHEITPIFPAAGESETFADVVGPICESGDTFGRARPVPPVSAGDLLAIRNTGAYGAAMTSTYNSRPLVPEVLVNGPKFAVIRSRGTYEDLIAAESSAPWLE